MNKKMRRYKGLILSCLSVMMLVISIFSFSFESKASTSALVGQEFTMNYPEPSTSDTQGYVHILMYRDDTAGAGYYVTTYFWSCFAESDGKFSPCEMQVTIRKNSLEFVPYGATSQADSAFYVVNSITNNGTYSMKKYSSTQRYTPTFDNDIVGYKFGGNAMVISDINNSVVPFTVYYAPDKSTQLLMDVINILSQMNTQQHLDSHNVWMKLIDILDSSEDIEDQLVDVTNYLKSIDTELKDIGLVLDEIFARAKTIISEQRKTNTWLEKIWNSIQQFFNPDEESKEESGKLESESNDKTDKLDDLNEQNKTDKTDIDGASNSVDENVDLESIDNYGKVLAVITENQYILQILLLVFSVALVAYVLFGKK